MHRIAQFSAQNRTCVFVLALTGQCLSPKTFFGPLLEPVLCFFGHLNLLLVAFCAHRFDFVLRSAGFRAAACFGGDGMGCNAIQAPSAGFAI
jgi:hypothetical protein